jgi:hypothetical protein
VSSFQDTRTATSLACIETKSSPRATVGPLGRDHTNDIAHYTPFSLYIYTHTQQEFTFTAFKFPSKFPSAANSKPWQTIHTIPTPHRPREAQTSVLSITSLQGRVTLQNLTVLILNSGKIISLIQFPCHVIGRS